MTEPIRTGGILVKAMPWICGIGIPIAAVGAAFLLPTIYSQGQQLARLEAQVAEVKADTSGITQTQVSAAATLKGLELSLATIGNKMDNVVQVTHNMVDEIDKRMNGLEADPSRLLVAVGQGPDADFRVFAKKNQLYMYAQRMDTTAIKEWELVELNPFVRAFHVPMDEATVAELVAAAAAGDVSLGWDSKFPAMVEPQ